MFFDDYDSPYMVLKRKARTIVIGFLGFTLLIIGIAMIVLPGPAIIIIPIAVIILASEFSWAKKIINKVRFIFPDHVLRRWFDW